MAESNNLLSRRKLLLGTATLAITGAAASLYFSPASLAQTTGNAKVPLNIPPLDKGRLEGSTRIYNLNIQDGITEFIPGLKTATRGINSSFLAPVLRMTKGENIRLSVTNSLGEDTTLHWHGFNLPAKADGGPHQVVTPGETWSPEFLVKEKASTMWYHSHLLHKTAEQVWSGIAGMIIIDDEQSKTLDIPNTYGVDDIPLALQDRDILTNGSMPYSPSMTDNMMGLRGEIPMANGTIGAFFDVSTALIRLRLLNGANGTIYTLGFSDNRPFKQIASDGGLLESPVEMSRLLLAPGERAEIIVDMSDGNDTTLTHFGDEAQEQGGMMGGSGMGMGQNNTRFSFLELRPANQLARSATLPQTLTSLPEISTSSVQNTRQLVLDMRMGMGMMFGGGFTINNEEMDMNVVNNVVPKGVTEIWELSNRSTMPHPLHIHNTQFRIIDRNGKAPNPNETGLKDTVLIQPNEKVRILIRFDEYSDPDRPYMYHCHILEHEDAGMMGQFTVV